MKKYFSKGRGFSSWHFLSWHMAFTKLFVILGLAMASVSIANADEVVEQEYDDTDFGELLYNEPSSGSKQEIVDLLEVDQPSSAVFLQALSMGLGIDEVLEAAIQLDSEQSKDFTTSAVSLLPIVSGSSSYDYGRYDIDSLEDSPYTIAEVAERFFESRDVLVPYPDWQQEQIHFEASVQELSSLVGDNLGIEWYRSKSSKPAPTERPIFVSLYEATKTVLVDGEERIEQALKEGPEATLPVVFIFNRLVERSIDTLGYPKTIEGARQAYLENALMVTPAPQWALGEYHIYAEMDEIQEIFELPTEEDFEPEEWQTFIDEAKNHVIEDEAFVVVILPSGEEENASIRHAELSYASNDSGAGAQNSLKSAFGQGLIVNRPQRLAALAAIGVKSVPIAFYYIDRSRIKPYKLGLRGLRAIGGYIPGTNPPPTPPSCASPPCR